MEQRLALIPLLPFVLELWLNSLCHLCGFRGVALSQPFQIGLIVCVGGVEWDESVV